MLTEDAFLLSWQSHHVKPTLSFPFRSRIFFQCAASVTCPRCHSWACSTDKEMYFSSQRLLVNFLQFFLKYMIHWLNTNYYNFDIGKQRWFWKYRVKLQFQTSYIYFADSTTSAILLKSFMKKGFLSTNTWAKEALYQFQKMKMVK